VNVHFGNPNPISGVADAISLYGSKEFASPTRSTVPMLSLLLRSSDVFYDIVKQLGMPSGYELYLEYKVKPPKGRGTASHTDVMLTAGTSSLAIEAKWTEPMYAPVSKWLKSGKDSSNREQVLDGWLSLLEGPAKTALELSDFDDSIYQMVHRAASAAAAGVSPRLTYFLFEPSGDEKTESAGDVYNQLEALWKLLRSPVGFPFSVVEITTRPTDAFDAIKHLPKNEQSTSDTVVAALLSETPLFDFSEFKIRRVGGNS